MPFKEVSDGSDEPYASDLASATSIEWNTQLLRPPADDHTNNSPRTGRWISSRMSVQHESPRQPQGIDMQLCLLNLPTPIIALGPNRKVIFANRAAEDLLSHEDPLRARHAFIGRKLPNLDISLLSHKSWKHVFDNFDSDQSSQGDAASSGAKVHEVEVVVEKHGSKGGSKPFRISLSSLAAGEETNYILSFERLLNREKKGGASITGPPTDAEKAEFRDTLWYKAATFDDSDFPGFIVSSDAKFYIPNKRTKEMFCDRIGDPQKHSYPYDKTYSEYWDEDFTRRLSDDELPGLRIVKERKPYKNIRYGYKVMSTGMRFVLTGSGQCLYGEAGQFIGGVCWFSSFQTLAEFLASEKGKDLRSHETICNLLPHMVWTTRGDAVGADWFSKRWYDYTGLTEEEATGGGFVEAFHPDDLPYVLEQLKIHNANKEEFQIQMRFRRHDGCYRWMIARAAPILGPDGEILRWYGTNTDIHEATVARLEADRIKDQIMAVLTHADLSLFAIDHEGKITMSEGQALKMAARMRDIELSEFYGMDSIELAKALDFPGSRGEYISVVL
jgi:PAS domain S-box-containing protein